MECWRMVRRRDRRFSRDAFDSRIPSSAWPNSTGTYSRDRFRINHCRRDSILVQPESNLSFSRDLGSIQLDRYHNSNCPVFCGGLCAACGIGGNELADFVTAKNCGLSDCPIHSLENVNSGEQSGSAKHTARKHGIKIRFTRCRHRGAFFN